MKLIILWLIFLPFSVFVLAGADDEGYANIGDVISLAHPGLVYQNVKSPHIYQKLHPLVFKFDLTIPNSELAQINSNLPVKDKRPKNAIQFFTKIFGMLLVKMSTKSKLPIEFDCTDIGKHFNYFSTDEAVFEPYLTKLMACFPFAQDHNVSNAILKVEFPEFEIDHSIISAGNDLEEKLNLNPGDFFVNNQSTRTGNSFMLSLKLWNWGIRSCFDNKQFPLSLFFNQEMDILKPEINLQPYLEKGLCSARKEGWSPTFTKDEYDLYYSTPLTDCTFSEHAFYVRLMIPMVKYGRKLINVKPLPFFFKTNEQSETKYCKIQGFEGEENQTYLVNTKGDAYKVNCQSSDGLCLADELELSNGGHQSLCVSAFTQNNRTGIQRHCPFTCTKVLPNSAEPEPIINIINKNQFLITGKIPDSLKIECQKLKLENAKTVAEYINPASLTNVLLIPCDCKLVDSVSTNKTYELNESCEPLVKIIVSISVIPFSWLPEKCLNPKFELGLEFFVDFTDPCFNTSKEFYYEKHEGMNITLIDLKGLDNSDDRRSLSWLTIIMIWTLMFLIVCFLTTCSACFVKIDPIRRPLKVEKINVRNDGWIKV